MSIVAMLSRREMPNLPKIALAGSTGAAPAYSTPLRIGFWGTHGLFSHQVLGALLKQDAIVHVVVPASLPGSRSFAPTAHGRTGR